jgi:AcrR family transcriptional regulator
MPPAPSSDDRIVAAALELIASRGLGGVTMTAVAAAAGVARQTLYNHYPDVDSIVVAAVERHAAASLAQLRAMLEVAGSVEAELATLVRHAIAETAHGGDGVDEGAGLSAAARSRIEEYRREVRHVIVAILARGGREQRFAAGIEPELHCYIVEGILRGGVTLARSDGDAARAAAVTTAALARALGL